MESERPQWTSRTKLTIALLLFAFGVYLLFRFSAVLQPLILAIILAYILTPAANWIQDRLHFRRSLSTLLAYILMLLIVITIPIVITPPLTAQSADLNLDLLRYMEEIEALLGNQYIIAGQTIDVRFIFEQATGTIQGFIEPFVGQTLGYVIEVITSLVWIVFILVVSFYLTKDALSLRKWFEDIIPPPYKSDFILLRNEISRIWSAFFRGQITLALIVATIFTIAGFIIGLPFALAMGVLAGLLEFLPSIGHGIWLIVASLLALFAGSTWINIPNWSFMLLVIGLHIIFQQFDLNYLIPRIIGSRVQLPPLVIILGIVAGALLAGVMGILLAGPVIASARVIGRYLFANLFDQDPFPDSVTSPLPLPNPRWWRKSSSNSPADPEDEI